MPTEGKLNFCFLKAHTQNDAFLLLVMALLDTVTWLCIILLSLHLLLYHSNVILLFLTASVGLVFEKQQVWRRSWHWWICSLCVLQRPVSSHLGLEWCSAQVNFLHLFGNPNSLDHSLHSDILWHSFLQLGSPYSVLWVFKVFRKLTE